MKKICIVNPSDELQLLLKQLKKQFSVKVLQTPPSILEELPEGDLFIFSIRSEYPKSLIGLMAHLSANGIPFLVHCQTETMKNAALAMKYGAADYFTRNADRQAFLNCIDRLVREHEICELPETEDAEDQLIGHSAKMQEIYKLIGKIASSNVSVLLRGPSGTGKERVARQIHLNSPRRSKPFVVIDCAAIPRELIENELFGHEKGAYSGAEERSQGKFDLGDGGTVFLDEIAELGLDLQSKILRVLQENEFHRIGGQRPIRVDVRIIAATNRNLEEMVRGAGFREDLYHRLNVITLNLPPLKDRLEDLPALVGYFSRRFARELQLQPRKFAAGVIEEFTDCEWPGNIRELENKVKRLLLTERGTVITREHARQVLREPVGDGTTEKDLLGIIQEGFLEDETSWKRKTVYSEAVSKVESALIKAVLAATKGNQVSAARILGISRNTLRIKMAELGIASDRFKSSG